MALAAKSREQFDSRLTKISQVNIACAGSWVGGGAGHLPVY